MSELRSFKKELNALIDKGEIAEVFTKIEQCDFEYEEKLLNDLRSRMIYNQTLKQIQELELFITSLSEKKEKISYEFGNIPKILGTTPHNPDVFLGRDEDLKNVRKQLTEGENILLLVNGEGGIGKTTLAAKYYQTYQNEYTHLAWIFAETSLLDAMLTLAYSMELTFESTMPTEQRLDVLLDHMISLKEPCLLIIDNANKFDDLEKYCFKLKRCKNFHLLVTSRITEFDHAELFKIEHLDEASAIELFTKYYTNHKSEEDGLLKNILKSVGYNTLVIELLAKNLQLFNRLKTKYSLENLLTDLQSKGLLAVQGKTVSTFYQAEEYALRKETPEQIISAMYDLGELSEMEKKMLSNFAVLPAENIPFEILEDLLAPVEDLDDILILLSQKGWLEFDEEEKAFKISPVVQAITINKNENILEDCESLIYNLNDKLEYEPSIGHLKNVSYQEAIVLSKYGESILNSIKKPNYSLSVLSERIGNFYGVTGDLTKSLLFNELCSKISKRLVSESPEDLDFKNGLAISYSKLGDTHSFLGNLDTALTFFKDETVLFEELYEAYPENVSFKNGLAISYEKLGVTHSSLGNLDTALTFFEDEAVLFEELYESYLENVSFKNGLAISYSKLGDTHSSLGNLEKALTFFEDYNRLKKELYDAYLENVSFKNGLAISYSKLGDTHSSLGNLEKALTFFEDYNRLEKDLFQAYPQNVSFKENLAYSYRNLGDIYKKKFDAKKSFSFYKIAEKIWEELIKDFPAFAHFSKNLKNLKNRIISVENASEEDLLVQSKINDALKSTSEPKETPEQKVEYQKSIITRLSEIKKEFPSNRLIIEKLSGSFSSLSWYHLFAKQFKEAETTALKGLKIDPSQTWINTNLASALLFQNKKKAAMEIYEKWKEKLWELDERYSTLKDAFLADLAELEKEGITHPDVEEVRAFLRGEEL